MTNNVRIYEKEMIIPTYGVGADEKNPMFLEKRVYQGSSGKVYPYPVSEKIYDELTDKSYRAVVLENDFLYVVVLPELGGRIYTAYDKTNGYDFVYHNKVIKPALVGLLGPWISGGIEFNWPQHHRPTTFRPVNFKLREYPDGSASVFVGETEAMAGLKQTTEIKLFPDKSHIEIKTDVYNRGALPETFLWWANPAYKVNDDTATVMPLDVTAVMDHGKRAVSTYPIATGEYYKMDYSAGVDISRYKNIPVPTSFMAYRSDFDFIGGYDFGRKAGLLHVANHRVSPGKKQWTWGSGDFGKAWDRNLTDEDGPYVELMTGCFTDNQPDFTFIRPHETKSFTQYFMPYHDVGRILNADENFCFGFENGTLTVYSSTAADAVVTAKKDGKTVFETRERFLPTETKVFFNVPEDALYTVSYGNRNVSFKKDFVKNFEIPSPAEPCPPPEECKTNEDLYLFGTHIEQYRHATLNAEDYYREGLRRDESDLRINTAYGLSLLRRGNVRESVSYFKRAIEKATVKNPNPKDTEAFYLMGIASFLSDDLDTAYDAFYKCLWGNFKQQAYYRLALISLLKKDLKTAITEIEAALRLNAEDTRALNFAARLYRDAGDKKTSAAYFLKSSVQDPLDPISGYENGDFNAFRYVSATEIRILSADLIFEKRYDEAMKYLKIRSGASEKSDPLIELYQAYLSLKTGKPYETFLQNAQRAANSAPSFPNTLADYIVLSELYVETKNWFTAYQLGNLLYDKKNYDRAAEYWSAAERANPLFPAAKRNLALYRYNKKRDSEGALSLMREAFALDRRDARILLETVQLYALCGISEEERFSLLDSNFETTVLRDDLFLEYIALTEARGGHEKAYRLLMGRKFHPWEGGEGKATGLYKRVLFSLSLEAEAKQNFAEAKRLLNACLVFPENLGEGKLSLDYDNDVWYRLGVLLEKTGEKAEAECCFRLATRGKTEITDGAYYNDSPVEYVFYIALARKKLGECDKAKEIKAAFRSAIKAFQTAAKPDYFAVSLPDMTVWEQDGTEKNKKFAQKLEVLEEQL